MLRLNDDQPSLCESILPPDLSKMNEELTKVDKLLDDDCVFAPFKEEFYTHGERPTVPVAIYLTMIYLKYRYRLWDMRC